SGRHRLDTGDLRSFPTRRSSDLKGGRDRREGGAHLFGGTAAIEILETDPHEEQPGFGIAELCRIADVEAVGSEKAGDGGNNARPVLAGKRQNKAHENVRGEEGDGMTVG